MHDGKRQKLQIIKFAYTISIIAETSLKDCEVRGPKPQLLVFINFTLISHFKLKINLDVHPSWVLSLLSGLIDIVVSTSLFR